MKANRLEAFSDGVLAIIITIMVLELRIPEGHEWRSLLHLYPKFLSYLLSFIYVGIYWNNHHHLLHLVRSINGRIMWLNMLLLFSLSLIPFTTAWMGESHFASAPTALYGIVLLLAAIAYWLLQNCILAQHNCDAPAPAAIGLDLKGKLSPPLYILGILLTFWSTTASCMVFAIVAVMWFIPDKRIERAVAGRLKEV